MKKGWFIFLTFIFLFNGISATISNVHISPEYPNLSSNLIKVYADVSDVSKATLYYRINNDIYSNPFSVSKGIGSIPYEDVSDNIQVFYWIVGDNETTQEYSFTYDGSAPAITITGDNPLIIEINSTYTELGATAIDSVYGDLTSSISTSGSVDTSTLGEYIITYTVSDNAGNIAIATRTVRVVEQPSPASYSGGGSSPTSESNPVIIINDTITNASTVEIPNPNEKLRNNSETNSKTGITGKSIIGFIGENKGLSIIIGILIILIIAGYSFIKIRIKRKLWGK